ncbi:MAG: hypothetical protein ACYTF6_07855, partial [Planctomycetota bacterium]
MALATTDRQILRQLARKLAEIAALPAHKEKAELWGRLNQLQPVRPLVWINEIPWHEMNVDDELTPRTSDPWAQRQERRLRMTIYQWQHMPGDMIVSDYLSAPLAIRSTGLGIAEDADIVKTDEASGVVSRRFHRQIVEVEDIEKIKLPEVAHDEAATEANYRKMCDVFGGIMPVRKAGRKNIWFAPWDQLIRLWGVQEAMMDLVLRPEMVNQ